MLTRVAAMLALVAAAGATGVFAGRASQSPDAGWQRGYDAGLRAARNAQGHEADRIAALYEVGRPGYDRIYAAGRREGQRLGRRLGRSEGISAARRSGFRAGRLTALPTFPGGWRASHWYLVRLEPGEHGSPFRIGSRVIVARGRTYGPCENDPDQICATPRV
jgi:hypothetical protein